jgi:hypothetical protein
MPQETTLKQSLQKNMAHAHASSQRKLRVVTVGAGAAAGCNDTNISQRETRTKGRFAFAERATQTEPCSEQQLVNRGYGASSSARTLCTLNSSLQSLHTSGEESTLREAIISQEEAPCGNDMEIRPKASVTSLHKCSTCKSSKSYVSDQHQDQHPSLILHTKVKDGMTVKQIVKLMHLHPNAVFELNPDRQTVLHVAASRALAPDMLLQLYMVYPGACAIQDRCGKYPLHDLASHLHEISDKFSCMTAGGVLCDDMLVGLLKMMHKEHTSAILEEDFREGTPIEYAILRGAPYRLVKTLQLCAVSHQHNHQPQLLDNNDNFGSIEGASTTRRGFVFDEAGKIETEATVTGTPPRKLTRWKSILKQTKKLPGGPISSVSASDFDTKQRSFAATPYLTQQYIY